MIQHPPATLRYCADVESEITRLLERIIELVEDCPNGQAVLHRMTEQIGPGMNADCHEQTVVKVEAHGASYTLIRCTNALERSALSPREQEIVRLVSYGHPNKAIARQLAISQHTVNTHVRRIFDKLGVSSRAEMVAFALQMGLMVSHVRYN